MAACAARPSSRSARCSSCSGAPGCAAPVSPADRREGAQGRPLARLLRPGRAHARAHVRGRHLRSSRRRLLALLGRSSAGWCRISRRCSTTTPSSSSSWRSPMRAPARPCSRRRARETVGWLAREMTTPEGAFCGLARCRFGRRGGQVLRLVARRDRGRARPGRCCVFCAALRRDRRGQFRGPQYSQSAQGLTRCARAPGRARYAAMLQASRSMTDEGRLAALREKLLAARGAGAARPRRQGAGRLERPDDRGPGQRRPAARTSRPGSTMARARLRLHCREHDPRRPARPFLARRHACSFPASPPTSPP